MREQTQKPLTHFFSSPSTSKRKSVIPNRPLFEISQGTPKKKRIVLDKDDSSQRILDAGQKHIGSQFCSTCGMVYGVDSIADRKAHVLFHNKTTDDVEFFRVTVKQMESWKKSFPSIQNGDTTIFCLKQDSICTLKAKAEKIIEEVINIQLGFCTDISIWGRDSRCSVWVAILQRESRFFVAAILISEILRQAHWNDSQELYTNDGGLLGINRIWTHPSARRRGLARQLVHTAMRKHYTKRFAISEPTDDGRRLALSISPSGKEGSRYLVYSIKK